MGKKLKKYAMLVVSICLSVSFTFTSFAAAMDHYDSKSGLINVNFPEPPRYENSDGQVVLTSESWEQTQPFFAGYAIVCTSTQFVQERGSYIFNYAIIDESGTIMSTFNFEGSFFLINLQFNRFVENPEGYIYWTCSSNKDGLYYAIGKLDGTQEVYKIPELRSSQSNDIHTIYSIGTFRNGSANVYKVRTDQSNFFDLKVSHEAVGSISIDGVYSTSINKESEYGDEVIPAYGTKQFAENRVTSGWKEDESGWWYDNGDGTYPVNQWKEIEGKQYYFGEDGYMYQSQYTPDGYWVDENGVWIESEPQLNPDEVEKHNTLGLYIEVLGDLYENNIFRDEEMFEEYVRSFLPDMSEEDIRYVINEVRSNYTFVPA